MVYNNFHLLYFCEHNSCNTLTDSAYIIFTIQCPWFNHCSDPYFKSKNSQTLILCKQMTVLDHVQVKSHSMPFSMVGLLSMLSCFILQCSKSPYQTALSKPLKYLKHVASFVFLNSMHQMVNYFLLVFSFTFSFCFPAKFMNKDLWASSFDSL